MFLKEKDSGELVEVLSLRDLTDPFHKTLIGRYNAGEELPDPKKFSKVNLLFPSGEPLPLIWSSNFGQVHGLGRYAALASTETGGR